jgi:hypothetical protein
VGLTEKDFKRNDDPLVSEIKKTGIRIAWYLFQRGIENGKVENKKEKRIGFSGKRYWGVLLFLAFEF